MAKGRRPRYYFMHHPGPDDLSEYEGWRIYDRRFLSPEGEALPILLCLSKRVARHVRNELNSLDERCDSCGGVKEAICWQCH